MDSEKVFLRVAVAAFLLFTIFRLWTMEERELEAGALGVTEADAVARQILNAQRFSEPLAPLNHPAEPAIPASLLLDPVGDKLSQEGSSSSGSMRQKGNFARSEPGGGGGGGGGGSGGSSGLGDSTSTGHDDRSSTRSSSPGGAGMIPEPVIHTFVINLNSNVDRHFVAENRIREQPGFEFHHVPAVNGRAIPGGCGGPMQGGPGESGKLELDLECVTQSHIKAIAMGAEYLNGENDFILIMEDDVSFGLRDYWRHRSLRRIATGWSETHCDWSLVLLAPWLQDKHWAGMYYHYLTESTNWQLLRKQRGDTFWGAAAYAINSKGIREVFEFLKLKPQHFPLRYDDVTGAPLPFFDLHASDMSYYCSVPRHGGILPDGVNATVLSDCLIFDIVEAPYISLPPLFVWDSSAIYSSTLHKDHEDAQGRGREKILEFALAVHDLDTYHHRICSVISGFGNVDDGETGDAAQPRQCLHVVDTAIVGVDAEATPLQSLPLRDDLFTSVASSPEDLKAAKLRYCCEQCEQHKGTTNRRGLRLLKKQTKSKSHLPSTTARETFLHLDDNKCAIWHVDSKLQYCHLWNANRGAPRSWKGHHTGIPEGQCPTQLSNTAVTPHQVCKPYALPPDVQVSPADAVQAFNMGTRPVVSSLKFPQALLLPSIWRQQQTDHEKRAKLELRMGRSPKGLDGPAPEKEYHTAATCVSRVDQSVSGFRNQTRLTGVPTVDDCCFACSSSPGGNCKAWTYDRRLRVCYVFNKTILHLTAFYQPAEGFVGGLVTERFCDMSAAALKGPGSFVLPNTDIKGWDIILPGVDQGFFAYSAQHCCVLVAAMDEYRLHGWTYDGTWNRCYPKVSRVGGMSVVSASRVLTSGILLQGVPKCATDKCIVPNVPVVVEPDRSDGSTAVATTHEAKQAFCDGTVDFISGTCINSRRKQRGYDCRDCMHCHDACQSFLFHPEGEYKFRSSQICKDFLSEWGSCVSEEENAQAAQAGLDCRGCRIRSKLYNGQCSHLCQYPERCNHWFSSDFECVPNFIYGFIIADCNGCQWPSDDLGLSVE